MDAATLKATLLAETGGRLLPLTISADGRTPHQAVVTVLDVAGQLGLRQLAIATLNAEPAESRRPRRRRPAVAEPLIMNWLDRYGYSLNLVAVLLWPLSLLFGAAVRGAATAVPKRGFEERAQPRAGGRGRQHQRRRHR